MIRSSQDRNTHLFATPGVFRARSGAARSAAPASFNGTNGVVSRIGAPDRMRADPQRQDRRPQYGETADKEIRHPGANGKSDLPAQEAGENECDPARALKESHCDAPVRRAHMVSDEPDACWCAGASRDPEPERAEEEHCRAEGHRDEYPGERAAEQRRHEDGATTPPIGEAPGYEGGNHAAPPLDAKEQSHSPRCEPPVRRVRREEWEHGAEGIDVDEPGAIGEDSLLAGRGISCGPWLSSAQRLGVAAVRSRPMAWRGEQEAQGREGRAEVDHEGRPEPRRLDHEPGCR